MTTPNDRRRKQAIVKRATEAEMPAASQIADGLHDVADAMRTLAGVLAWGSVQEHSPSHGRQSEMAAVVLRFASEGYFHTKIDGQKVSEAESDEARKMLDKLFGKSKR